MHDFLASNPKAKVFYNAEVGKRNENLERKGPHAYRRADFFYMFIFSADC